MPVSLTPAIEIAAGFICLISGNMRTMPGLSRSPAADQIDIDGNVVGLYWTWEVHGHGDRLHTRP